MSQPLTVFNTILLIGTGYLSYSSFVFQTQTGIREGLEQLDDIEFRSGKLRPLLHSFEYSAFSESNAVVLLKWYRFGNKPATSNRPGHLFHGVQKRFIRDLDDFEELGNHDHLIFKALENSLSVATPIEEISVNNSGIFLHMNSGDAVVIRRFTEYALEHFYNLLMQRSSDVVRELEIEGELSE